MHRDPGAGVEIFEGAAVFEDVPNGDYDVATDIPGHGAHFVRGCVSGAGPVPDDSITPEGNPATLTDDAGATCVIYLVPEVFRG